MNDTTRADVFTRLRTAQGGAGPSPRTTVLDTARYTDPAALAAELGTLFRQAPCAVAHASELPEVGSFVRARLGDLPLLVVRAEDGVGVFVNACRHRGAELVEAASGCRKALTCRYHAWTYRLDGALLHVPSREAFAALPDDLGLIRVPSGIRHGLVWARRDGDPDVAGFLGADIDADLDAFGLEAYRQAHRVEHERSCNWKLVMDAFSEGYHVESLHRKSLARFFTATSLVDDLDPHVRQVGARRNLAETLPAFDLATQTTVFYNLFPNSVLVFHPTWLTWLELVPLAPDRVRVVHRMLVPPDASPEDAERRMRSFSLIDGQVFQAEDLEVSESVQRSLSAGVIADMRLGIREEGMRLFHRARDRWIDGDPTGGDAVEPEEGSSS